MEERYPQIYETTVMEPELGSSARFLVIPRRYVALPDEPMEMWYREYMEMWNLWTATHKQESQRVWLDVHGWLISDVSMATIESLRDSFVRLIASTQERHETTPWDRERHMALFANYLLTASIVPVEHSPLTSDSLQQIVLSAAKGGTVTLGATVGYLAAGETTAILITVPLGIILVGFGSTFTKWLDENRSGLMKKFIKLPDDQEKSEDSEDSEPDHPRLDQTDPDNEGKEPKKNVPKKRAPKRKPPSGPE